MSVWNYVVTEHNPCSVSHSCVGYFTGARDLNLILGKGTRLEIHLITSHEIDVQHRLILDVPVYGRIQTLELFRPHGHTQDSLLIATYNYKLILLQWNASSSELITRAMRDDVAMRDAFALKTVRADCRIGIIDPDCRFIGLHLFDFYFEVVPFDNKGQLEEPFAIEMEEMPVLDIKFLFGYAEPTIAVLYQENLLCNDRHVNTYEINLKDQKFAEGPWSLNNLDEGAHLLITLPPPLCGVLIIGVNTILYRSASANGGIQSPIRRSFIEGYERLGDDCSRYLLWDNAGLLILLGIEHEGEKVTGLSFEPLGETSIASSISYLENAVVFVGSSLGDSQLVGEIQRILAKQTLKLRRRSNERLELRGDRS